MRSPEPQLLDLLSAFDPPVAALALALRKMLLEEAPDTMEKIYKDHPSAAWFGVGPKMHDMFCYVAAARNHVNLGFCQGASLPDPHRVLKGTGKVMRHIKFSSERDLGRTFVRGYIRAASETLRRRGYGAAT